jgi:hypothetical protein
VKSSISGTIKLMPGVMPVAALRRLSSSRLIESLKRVTEVDGKPRIRSVTISCAGGTTSPRRSQLSARSERRRIPSMSSRRLMTLTICSSSASMESPVAMNSKLGNLARESSPARNRAIDPNMLQHPCVNLSWQRLGARVALAPLNKVMGLDGSRQHSIDRLHGSDR